MILGTREVFAEFEDSDCYYPHLQMRKQRFTDVKHYYKLQDYFNRIRGNKAIRRRIPFVSIGSASHQTCKAAAQPTHSGDRQAEGGGRWCQGPRIPLRTIGWRLV